MKVIMCDRCGRTYGYGKGGFVLIVGDTTMTQRANQFIKVQCMGQDAQQRDLCAKCKRDFERWFKNIDNEHGPFNDDDLSMGF